MHLHKKHTHAHTAVLYLPDPQLVLFYITKLVSHWLPPTHTRTHTHLIVNQNPHSENWRAVFENTPQQQQPTDPTDLNGKNTQGNQGEVWACACMCVCVSCVCLCARVRSLYSLCSVAAHRFIECRLVRLGNSFTPTSRTFLFQQHVQQLNSSFLHYF